jgi:FkbM family methyltransferase
VPFDRLNVRSAVMVSRLKALVKRLLRGRYFSLNELDRKLERYVDYNGGYFVELGANDGVTQSNSLYFEKHRGWRGVLVEPAPHKFLQCRKNRGRGTSVFCAACVSFDYSDEFVRIIYSNLMSTPIDLESDIADPLAHAERGGSFLKSQESIFEFGAVAKTLNSLLIEASAPKLVDFLSLDVEGAEIEVLKGIDHREFRFRYILVECRDIPKLKSYLEQAGYRFVEKFSEQDYLFAAKESDCAKRSH